jgi:hypothetical protein
MGRLPAWTTMGIVCLTLGFVGADGAAAAGSPAKARSLFDGKDLTGWHADVPALDKDPDAKNPFLVRDGMLVTLGKPGGHLVTDEAFENYRLTVDYRFPAKPGNAGVVIHCSKPRVLRGMFPQGIEVQMAHKSAGDFWLIGEDMTVPDMEERRGPKENWKFTLEDKGRHIKKLVDAENPEGEWNTMVVECVANEVGIWENGKLVNRGTGCTATKGQLGLQSEGSEVEFRKIELTPIDKISEQAP